MVHAGDGEALELTSREFAEEALDERVLRDLRKLRLSEDEPDSPAYVRDRTPLKKGQITTLVLRDEFRVQAALDQVL